MRKLLTLATCAVFLVLLFQGVTLAQQASSGDKKFDGYLNQMNQQGEQNPEGFVRHLSETYGIPQDEIRQAREQHKLTYGDTYMAAALAKQSQKKVGDVAAQFKQQGQGKDGGWGMVAQENGVKPGSPQFHQMKNQAKGSVSKLKAQNRHRMRLNEQNLDKEKKRTGSEGEPGQGQDQGQGQGQGKGKGKGQDKGQGGKGGGGKR